MTRKERKIRSDFHALVKEARKYLSDDTGIFYIGIHHVKESAFPANARVEDFDSFKVAHVVINKLPPRELRLFT